MTDPVRRAKPVGPPPPGGPQPPPPQASSGSPSQQPGSGGGYGAPPEPPYMRVYSWSSAGRSFPWFAILLLVLGLGLLIEILIPDLSFGSLIILAAGVAFGAAWLWGHVVGATVPALVLTAWGLASIGRDFDVLTGDGWNTLSMGLAFLVGWGLARFQHVRRQYALWVGAVLSVIGLADVSDRLPFDISIAVVIPLAMIAIGVYMVYENWVVPRR